MLRAYVELQRIKIPFACAHAQTDVGERERGRG